ncbi:MAG: hypothetical protein M3O68_05190 [Thermoproteota archaeon]|nr:hypothetical protein [Thermoproteota archaeon]
MTVLLSFTLFIPNVNVSFALQYTDYLSEKYQIAFQYPSDWTIKEKSNKIAEGTEIEVSDKKIGNGKIGIHFYNDLLEGFGSTDFDFALSNFYKHRITDDLKFEYKTIQPPSLLEIDSHKTGSFHIMFSQKDEIDPISGEVQYWITFVGENGYMIEFLSIPENFDTPDNTEMRDRFISSIDFLGLSNTTDASGRISSVAMSN